MLNIKRIFETIADAGQKILEKKSFKSITKKRDLIDLCDDLLSTKGAAFGITLARDILFRYQNLSIEEKNKFLIQVNDKYKQDPLKIEEAIKMLEIAYEAESEDPYIIDSIGWAYYLVDDYLKAEKFLNIAVQLMPDDPIVSDHYGDILWKLDRKIQARYFWKNVLQMKDAEKEMIKNINIKLIYGLDNS